MLYLKKQPCIFNLFVSLKKMSMRKTCLTGKMFSKIKKGRDMKRTLHKVFDLYINCDNISTHLLISNSYTADLQTTKGILPSFVLAEFPILMVKRSTGSRTRNRV